MMRWVQCLVRRVKYLFAKIMRRKISLHIAGQKVDLDDQSFVLFNYTMEDLSNPTIVKNSFSQQITLKGTPTNNRVFGKAFLLDRAVANTGGEAGADFNPSQKTPFTIYNEMNEVLESGYVKLDSVTRQGADIDYKVTLYGGLGAFFYALSYDSEGNRLSLADLNYLGGGDKDGELDFNITAQAVQEAWDRLINPTGAATLWDVINFAPAYNGIPEGNFDPTKGIILPDAIGLPDDHTEGGVLYSTKGVYSIINFSQAHDEWAVKDLRSYLQRPVLSMKAFWNAICDPDNNGGYEVDATAVVDYMQMGAYANMWMTLPMLSSIGDIKQTSGNLSATLTPSPTTGNEIGRYDIVGSVGTGTKVTATIKPRIRFDCSATQDTLRLSAGATSGRTTTRRFSAIFIQAVAYASDNTIVGGSKVKVIGLTARQSGAALASACGYTPLWAADYEKVGIDQVERVSLGGYQLAEDISFVVEAQNVAYYKIMMSVFPAVYTSESGGSASTTYSGDGSTSIPTLYASFSARYTPSSTFVAQGGGWTLTYTSSASLRSGAHITKAMLLSSSHTPAEYMLSFCKMFGLYFDYDPATRKVTILKRNDLYRDNTIDLTGRVDLSKGVNIRPLTYSAKWYDFILEGAGGAFYDEYLNTEGIPYGIQRVNTGYDFDAVSVNLMDSVVFKNACTILARSPYFNYILKGQVFQPSPLIDKGNTYTLWASTGETIDLVVPCPPTSASVTYYNDRYRGYDINTSRKLELRDAAGKPLDGSDILVFLEGWDAYDYFRLSDDLPVMDTLNNGVPCWYIYPWRTGQNALRIPAFSRYTFGGTSLVEASLDFGVPHQFDIPGLRQAGGSTIYEKGWKKYLSDRLNLNTKVMTCRVNFAGMQVGRDLLRQFYWYDNSLWVLNKITNYSLTTFDPVECEFVQVQDKDNYLSGQSY